ncbi:conserved Plasmodium protein, unknown function [Plasmodium reichenowi]|uniref:PPM-type phosphatase domain-containing protein n=1 Tax=Plasmodium reichenowi TaxID=5854 RepID=A0A2P9D934_PLARE|nr:conserved Plasmodium protein, unknown function [Plasmodium reichenowi]
MNNKGRSKKEKYLYNQYDQCYDIFLKKNDITNIVIPEKKSEVTNTHIEFEQKKEKRKEKYPYRIIRIIKSHENDDIVFYSVKKINKIYKKKNIYKINKLYRINKIEKYNSFINSYEHILKDIYLKKKKNSLPSNNIYNILSIIDKDEEENVTCILKKNHIYNFLKYNNFIILAFQIRKKYNKSKKIIKSFRKFNYFILNKCLIENYKDHYNNKNNISLECKNNIEYHNTIYDYNKKTQKFYNHLNKQNDHLIYKECNSYKNILKDQNKITHDHNDSKNIQTFNFPLIYTLINNIKCISNYKYIIEKKLCYECYSKIKLNKIKEKKKENTNDMNDHTYVNINEYMKRKKKEKKSGDIKNIYPNKLNRNEQNKKLTNSYIFTYGFYSKKGKYHQNEDCSSHTLFSSYKIFKQIKKFYTNIKKRKYSFFQELMKVFHQTHIENTKNNSNKMKNKKTHLINPDTYYHNDYMKLSKVYVKVCNPFFFISLKKPKKNQDTNKTYPYDIISNYFCDNLDEEEYKGEHIKNKIKQKKDYSNKQKRNQSNGQQNDYIDNHNSGHKNILYNNNTNNIKKVFNKKQIISNKINSYNNKTNVLNYKVKELTNLMNNNEGYYYCTYDNNIRRRHKYIFTCKNCKKKEFINKNKYVHVNYLKYLFNKKSYLNKKQYEPQKYFLYNKYNIYDDNLFDLLNEKNNSTNSDEFEFLKFHKKKKKKKKIQNDNPNNYNYNYNHNYGHVIRYKKKNIICRETDRNDMHKEKCFNDEHVIEGEHYFKKHKKSNMLSLKNYFIKCKTCRRLYKYDNLINEDILNMYRRDSILMSPLIFNRSPSMLRSLLLSCYKNKNRKNLKYYIMNSLYIQTCRKARKEIKKDVTKENKKKSPIIENYYDNINICDTICHGAMSNASYYYSDLEVYKKDHVGKCLEKKLKTCLLINKLNNYHRSNSCNIRRDQTNGMESFNMYKVGYMNNYYMTKDILYIENKDVHNKPVDNKYIPCVIRKDNLSNKEMLFNYIKGKNRIHSLYDHYDIHLFTICDGHSSCHTSSFLIKNIHKIFYYLLIHTFFNIYMSLKLIHPFLDLLYYKMCMENNLKKCNGSCIINVFIRRNYIYVSNTGDSKCSLMTFNLDMYDYEDIIKKGENKKQKKGSKETKQKGTRMKGMKARLHREEDIINTQAETINCDDNIYDEKKTKDKDESNYESYKINIKSISYNELNAEHNCNNYSEYLRIYNLYMKQYDNEHNNYKMSAHNGYNTNVREDHTYNNLCVKKIDKNMCKNICCKNMNKNTNKTQHCDNHHSNNMYDNLKDTIFQINNFILKEKEETQINIGNIPNDIIKYNRLNGCLHPSRVIGDYDIKKRYNRIHNNILSNYSNVYKYNMNNINFYNNIHYLYKYKKCFDCGKNYVLNSYGKVNDINDLTFLKKQKQNLHMKNDDIIKKNVNINCNNNDNNTTNVHKNMIQFVNVYETDSKQNKNIHDNFYYIKENKNINNNYNNNNNNIRNITTHSNVIKVYKENLYNHNYSMDTQSNDNKKKKKNNFHFYPDEQLLPYLHFKPTNLNKNYVYKFDKKNFFHLLLIASDGVFEYINPYIILNIIKKHKSIYTKIQKIYYFYNNYIKYMNSTKYYLNYMTDHFLITSKECFELSRDIVRTTIRMGNYDDSSCFCIFLFPQFG